MTGANHIDADVEAIVCASTGAERVLETEVVQTLWSGYGQICLLYTSPSPRDRG